MAGWQRTQASNWWRSTPGGQAADTANLRSQRSTLARLVGISKALELMWTGEKVGAKDAERMGMVNKVVTHDELMKSAREFAVSLARSPSLAIEMIKKMAYTSMKSDSVMTQMAVEDFMQQVCRESEDVREGVMSFLEKREPKFTGR